MGVELYQKLSQHLLRWSYGFIFQFVNMVYHIDWFAYIEESLHSWNKPNLTREVTSLSFWCVAEFRLLKFCWGFLHLCSSVTLACNFLFLLASLSGFSIRMMVASQNEFGSFYSSSIFWKNLSRIGVSCSINFW